MAFLIAVLVAQIIALIAGFLIDYPEIIDSIIQILVLVSALWVISSK
ncbi:hypothetical protein [Pseudolactococcus insecticola]|nr:hypothetical protein [Lactococcus insecticola]